VAEVAAIAGEGEVAAAEFGKGAFAEEAAGPGGVGRLVEGDGGARAYVEGGGREGVDVSPQGALRNGHRGNGVVAAEGEGAGAVFLQLAIAADGAGDLVVVGVAGEEV